MTRSRIICLTVALSVTSESIPAGQRARANVDAVPFDLDNYREKYSCSFQIWH